jgi:hypothetical protein
MNIDSIFKFDIFLYNSLLYPKILSSIIKNRKVLSIANNSEKLKNSAKNKIIYICGNGPSLNKVDFNNIYEDYLVVNDFYRFINKNKSNPPKYYMIMDDAYLQKDLEERLFGVFNPGFETTYLINGTMYNEVSKRITDQNKIYYFCPWGRLFNSNKYFDFSKIHSRTWNVVCEAILFAIYAGYKEIRLLGCDYSVFARNAHFYSQSQNHDNLRKMLFKYCFTTHVHYEILKYAKKYNIEILNMTKETLLDAYNIDTNSEY